MLDRVAPGFEVFATDGTFISPLGWFNIKVCMCGGGGGGGGGQPGNGTSIFGAGYGGSGSGNVESVVPVEPGEIIPISIGDGGIGGYPGVGITIAGAPGSNGQPSIFGSYLTAQGGIGGSRGYPNVPVVIGVNGGGYGGKGSSNLNFTWTRGSNTVVNSCNGIEYGGIVTPNIHNNGAGPGGAGGFGRGGNSGSGNGGQGGACAGGAGGWIYNNGGNGGKGMIYISWGL